MAPPKELAAKKIPATKAKEEMIVEPTYKEPSREKMQALFDKEPLRDDFDTFGTEIMVLPISLADYKKLFYDSDGPGFANDLHKKDQATNKLSEQSDWIAPLEVNSRFFGFHCQSQRTQDWYMYASQYFMY